MTRQPQAPGPQSPQQGRDPTLGNRVIESFYDFFSGLYPGSFVANGALPAAANNSFFNPNAPGGKEVENIAPARRNQSHAEHMSLGKQALSPGSSPSHRPPHHPAAASRPPAEQPHGQAVSRHRGPSPEQEWYGEPPPGGVGAPAQAEPADRWYPDYARGRDTRPGQDPDRGYDQAACDAPPRQNFSREGTARHDHPEHASSQCYPGYAGGWDFAQGAVEYGCREYSCGGREYPTRNEYGPGPDYTSGPDLYGPGVNQDYGAGFSHPVYEFHPGQQQQNPALDFSCPSFPVPPYSSAPSYIPPGQDVSGAPSDSPMLQQQPQQLEPNAFLPAEQQQRQQTRERVDSRDYGRGRRGPVSPSYDRQSPTHETTRLPSASPSYEGARRQQGTSPTGATHSERRGASTALPVESKMSEYPTDMEDLLDQHVAYYLRRHPEAKRRHAVSRRGPGLYQLDGREVNIEWQYASEPGQQGCLVVVDGPLRQPFSDYMEDTEANATYEGQDIGTSALHEIPRDRRISFNDQHKVYSRLEAMKVAKEQALVRERAAGFVREGREVPGDIMTRYKKTIQQKLGLPRRPASPQRSKRSTEMLPVGRDGQEPVREAQQGSQPPGPPQPPQPSLPPQPSGGPPQQQQSPHSGQQQQQPQPPHHAGQQPPPPPPPHQQGGSSQQQGVSPQCLSPHSKSPHSAMQQQQQQHGFGLPSQQQQQQQSAQSAAQQAAQQAAQHERQQQQQQQQHQQQHVAQQQQQQQHQQQHQQQQAAQQQAAQQQAGQQQGLQPPALQQQGLQAGQGMPPQLPLQQGLGPGVGAGGPAEASSAHGVQRFTSHTPPVPPVTGGGHHHQTSSASYAPPPTTSPNAAMGSSSVSYTPPPVPQSTGPTGIPPMPGTGTGMSASSYVPAARTNTGSLLAWAGPDGMSALSANNSYVPAARGNTGGGQSPHSGLQGPSNTMSTASLAAALGTQPLGNVPMAGGASASTAPPPGAPSARCAVGPLACPSMGHSSYAPAMGTPGAAWRNTTPAKAGRQLSTTMPPPPPPMPWPLGPALHGVGPGMPGAGLPPAAYPGRGR